LPTNDNAIVGDIRSLFKSRDGGLRRDAIKLALQPVVLDGDVLTFDVAGFTKPLAERSRRRVRGRRGGDDRGPCAYRPPEGKLADRTSLLAAPRRHHLGAPADRDDVQNLAKPDPSE
jgi:hypothetical protein